MVFAPKAMRLRVMSLSVGFVLSTKLEETLNEVLLGL